MDEVGLPVQVELTVQEAANRIPSQSLTPLALKWKELQLQQTMASKLKENLKATIFLNLPAANTHLWLNEK